MVFDFLTLATQDIRNRPLTGRDEECWEMIQQKFNIYGYEVKLNSGKRENVSYF